MKIDKFKILTILLSVVLLIIFFKTKVFNEAVYELDEHNVEVIKKYELLPLPVRNIIETNINNISKLKGDFYKSLDSTVFYYGCSSRGDSWINESTSTFNHFFVDGLHYKLSGNRGKVFILYNNEIYYSGYMINESNYKGGTYYKIQIKQ